MRTPSTVHEREGQRSTTRRHSRVILGYRYDVVIIVNLDSGRRLELRPDDHDVWFPDLRPGDADSGITLVVDGQERGHLFTRRPARLRDAALRRIAAILGASAPLGEPLSLLHHGSGMLSLARHLEATRSGSTQFVVDVDTDVTDAVTSRWTLPESLVRVEAPSGHWFDLAASEAFFDLAVLDLSIGMLIERIRRSEETATAFFEDLRPLLGYSGKLAIVLGDREPRATGALIVKSLMNSHMRVWTLSAETHPPGLSGRGSVILAMPAEVRSDSTWMRAGFDWDGIPTVMRVQTL